MAITAEERREINLKNASRSTGPKSACGKKRASLNAMKHGLRAEALALPNEDVEELRQMTDDWLDYHEPKSPGERAAVDRCVYADLQLRRCARFHAAVVDEQVRKAGLEWQWACDDELERLKKLLKTEPEEAARLLKRSALGCRWMLAEWEELAEALEKEGTWANSQRDRAIRLIGQRPEAKHMPDNETAYLIRFYTVFTVDKPGDAAIDHLLDPRNQPDTLHKSNDGSWLPTPEMSRETLRAVIEEETEALTALEERLRVEIEEPSRAGAEERASSLRGPEGVLLARYVRMHGAMYDRAYKTLTQGEKKAAKEDAPAKEAPSAFDPFAEVEVLDLAVGRPGAPNEANPDGPVGASPGAAETPLAGIKMAPVDMLGRKKGKATPSAPLGRVETPPAQGS